MWFSAMRDSTEDLADILGEVWLRSETAEEEMGREALKLRPVELWVRAERSVERYTLGRSTASEARMRASETKEKRRRTRRLETMRRTD